MSDKVQIPGYMEAVEREARERLLSYLDPLTEVGGTIRLRQLTPRIYLELSLTGNSIVTGRPTAAGAGVFCWRLQKDFDGADTLQRDRIFRAVAACKWPLLRADLRDYIERTFGDQPASAEQPSHGFTAPKWCWLASIVDVFGAEYGWTRETVLDSSFRCLYQELRCIIGRHNPKAIFLNRSDQAMAAYLRGDAAPVNGGGN